VDCVLSYLGSELRNLLHDVSVGVRCVNNLDQLHHLHRVKEVQPNKLLGSSRSDSHVGDGQRRGVGCEHARRLDQRAQLFVEVNLDVLLFNNSLG
jgi:hypothetical protein